MPLVAGRPPERERHWLIRSGYVFVYEESMAQIKRWTDSVPWSPSRAFTNMLVYRQVTKRFKAGSRRVLAKKARDTSARTVPYSPRPSSSEGFEPSMDDGPGSPSVQETASESQETTGENQEMDHDLEALSPEQRKLVVGSLADSYEFKPAGLCKKTLSIVHDGRKYHIVSYYVIRDVVTGALRRPVDACPRLRGVDIQSVLEQNQYKFDIDSSGYYSSNPVKGEDENYRQGRLRESREYSAEFDSSSSDIDVELQSMNIANLSQMDHGERQLPAPFPQEVGHGGYQFPTNDGWPSYLSPRNQFSQQQPLSFSQQQYPPNHQQPPLLGSESNFFISVGQYSPPMVSSNQQPRTIPDESAFVYGPNLQFAGPADMEPTIPNYLNRGTGMDLSQYRIGRRDEGENEGVQINNPHRLGTTSLGPTSQWAHAITPVNLHPTVEEEYTIPTHYQPESYPWAG